MATSEVAPKNQEDLIRKVRGLLKKAESTTFEAEADAFVRKAQELMIRYAISEEQIWANDPDRRQNVEKLCIQVDSKKPGAQDKRIILRTIAELSNCRMYYEMGTNNSWVVGFPTDLVWVEILYTSIITQANFKQAMGIAIDNRNTHHRTFKSNWWEVYADTVSTRLKETYREATLAARDIIEGGSQSLVLLDRKVRVDKWMEDNIRLRKVSYRPTGTYSEGARKLGKLAGQQTDLSGGKPRMGGQKELGS